MPEEKDEKPVTESFKPVTYRHESINRFRIAANVTNKVTGMVEQVPCEFRNHLLTIRDETLNEAFMAAIAGQPRRIQEAIVVIDEEAARQARRPISNVIRGRAQGSADIKAPSKGGAIQRPTAKDESDTNADTPVVDTDDGTDAKDKSSAPVPTAAKSTS